MKIKNNYDVVVVGGGPGGVCAAAAAAAQGASTLLIERYGFLGGMATAGLVNPFMAYKNGGQPLTTSCFNSILSSLRKYNALCSQGQIFDDEVLKIVLDKMMSDAGVDVLLHSVLCGTDIKIERTVTPRLCGYGGADNGETCKGSHSDQRINNIEALTKGGLVQIGAKIFIDATGDGDLAYLSGAQYETGRKHDSACQPMTLCFKISGVSGDLSANDLGLELTEILLWAKTKNLITQPREDVLVFGTLTPGTYHFNSTRILSKKGTCSFDLTDAEIEGRRQAFELMELFQKYSPLFKKAGIIKLACQIGIRETRRIGGLYKITEEDILEGRKFDDGIARSCYPVDIHNPDGSGTVLKHLEENQYYEIPLRSLIAKDFRNLLIGSRCICSTHEAHSSLRVMPVVAGIGEAAGLTAAAAVSGQMEDVREVDRHRIRDTIFDVTPHAVFDACIRP
ncbi:MAG: FAD-dependent oxidoreductase [Chitinispirillales bacterium]|nr:FAD-dependent oxidoreductase [Chitinispirillales bacterium]